MWVAYQTSSKFLSDLLPVLIASVPAWSMIAGAVGAPPRRKLSHAVGLLAFVLVFDTLAFVAHWQAFATGTTHIGNAGSGGLVLVYQLAVIAGPVVTLLLFAGKRPSVFWES